MQIPLPKTIMSLPGRLCGRDLAGVEFGEEAGILPRHVRQGSGEDHLGRLIQPNGDGGVFPRSFSETVGIRRGRGVLDGVAPESFEQLS